MRYFHQITKKFKASKKGALRQFDCFLESIVSNLFGPAYVKESLDLISLYVFINYSDAFIYYGSNTDQYINIRGG